MSDHAKHVCSEPSAYKPVNAAKGEPVKESA